MSRNEPVLSHLQMHVVCLRDTKRYVWKWKILMFCAAIYTLFIFIRQIVQYFLCVLNNILDNDYERNVYLSEGLFLL